MPLYSLQFPTAHRYAIRHSTRVPGTAASAGDSTARSILSQTKPSPHKAPHTHTWVSRKAGTRCVKAWAESGAHISEIERPR